MVDVKNAANPQENSPRRVWIEGPEQLGRPRLLVPATDVTVNTTASVVDEPPVRLAPSIVIVSPTTYPEPAEFNVTVITPDASVEISKVAPLPSAEVVDDDATPV